ncbi:hypothetical protein HJC23_011471 [Cyclotella cryptica]|uniref:Peptidase S28 n=1 Tax=Cyclotella cryptica TaxID=29204 RepID=A0ABD3NUL9_9STRA|eukprot:CCRYP_019871-RA/>CCRYP_019871-RA protein AED:0.02 eAED:0.02 QI:229/1/1/1/1/1/3/3241/595
MKLLLILALLADQARALPTPRRIPEILAEIKQRRHRTETVELQASPEEYDDVQTLFLDQRLDHFSKSDDPKASMTFRQRYFYTGRYVHDETEGQTTRQTAAFLCVGGEGPSLKPSVLVDSVHCTGDMIGLAAKLFNEHNWDIHMFALEHRYYGESVPSSVVLASNVGASTPDDNTTGYDYDNDLMNGDFTYLSSRQAIHDVIEFVQSPEVSKHMSSLSSTNINVQWITFGGSYPGMLSAWSRLLFPDIIHGAVANSAPVQAELDFREYYDRVALDLADEAVGGSEECRRIFVEGHAQIVAALEGGPFPKHEDVGDDPVEYVATLFNICDGAEALLESRRNIEVLIGDGILRVPAQENDPSCEKELCNIQKLCDAITGERQAEPNKSSMEILAKINGIELGNECSNVDWTLYVDYFSTPTPENANDRSWMYQTCTEFGFYQTCQIDSQCPYGKGYHDVDRDLELCQKVFGIDPADVATSVQSTLEYYGGWELTPSAEAMDNANSSSGPRLVSDQGEQRILFANGDVDPWTELAVSGARGATNQLTVTVPGASHHFWTHKVQDTDGAAIEAARKGIYNTVSSWLGVGATYPLYTAME